jgi:hypothetical protein
MVGAGIVLAASTALVLANRGPLGSWYYHLAWYATLVGLDAILGLRAGWMPWLGRPRFAASLLAWSVPVWLLFELANFRVANWYYVMAEPDLIIRRIGTALAFGTVLPAIFLGYRTMQRLRLARTWRWPSMGWPARHGRTLQVIGAGFATLALWRPVLFFPLIWGSVTLLLEPFNLDRDPRTSLVADLARGQPTRIVRLLAAGAVIGLLWELLNTIARPGWVYTVPGLEGAKLFEMPFLGYLGFPVFALDCFVIYQALVHLRLARDGWEVPRETGSAVRSGTNGHGHTSPSLRPRLALAVVGAILFSGLVMAGMDRYTVDSYHPGLERSTRFMVLDGERLRAAGLGTLDAVAESDANDLAHRIGIDSMTAVRWVNHARLSLFRGIGAPNAAALEAAGIETICELAGAEPARVRDAIRVRRGDPRAGANARIRVWQRAALRECGT